MCEALKELMKDELDQAKAEGQEAGEDRLGRLISLMIAANDNEAIEKVSTDKRIREEYYAKYNV